MNYTDAALRTVLAGQSKSSDDQKQNIDNLVSWEPAISKEIEGDVPNEAYAELRQLESDMLSRIQTRVGDDGTPMQAALEAGVVGDMPEKLCAGVTSMKQLYSTYDEADRLVAAQANEDSLRNEMKKLGAIQQKISSIKDQIKVGHAWERPCLGTFSCVSKHAW